MVAMGEAVTVEARYTVGEYDIVILSATESRGLERWLRHNGYRIPAGAARVLGSYIRQNLHFFVAKVNLKEQKKLGFTYLRPIQVAYESPKFMLPVRLGTVNADGPQELFLYTITRKGRVEPVNYRSSRLPSDTEVPEYVKEEFARFYRSLFEERVRKEGMQSVFLEYAWDMASCDPCAAEPLSREELSSLGVFWLGNDGGPQQTFVTRLHARYDAAHFPTDLVFQETGDRASFQGRFVLRHPWKGTEDCPEMARYRRDVRDREETQAKTLADLTGWRLGDIRHRMAIDTPLPEIQEVKWYQRLWPRASR